MLAYHYGAVVGITHYPGISDLSGPVLDAESFREWLVDPAGGDVPVTNVRTVTTPAHRVPVPDPFDARPIKREIDRALELLNSQAQNEIADDPDRWAASRLYLYVAGHGIMPGEGEAALLMADARPGVYENVELRSYLDWYRRCGIFREVVVLADCCRNWFGHVAPSVVSFARCSRPAAQVFALVGYAAGPGDPAYERVEDGVPPDERRGYFTTALLEGLRGAAAEDPKAPGAITSTTLAGYVADAVAEATKDKAVPQSLEMPSDPGHPIILAKVRAAPTFWVTITFPAGWSAPVELLHPSGRRELCDPAAGPWMLELPAGLYGVFLPGTFDGSPFAGGGAFSVTGGAFSVTGGPRDVRL
jgi:hypothetical protein